MYVPFILFEGISKSILFNSILNFAILSVFNMRNVFIWHLFGGQRLRSVYSQQKVCSPPPPRYSEPWPLKIQNLPTLMEILSQEAAKSNTPNQQPDPTINNPTHPTILDPPFTTQSNATIPP